MKRVVRRHRAAFLTWIACAGPLATLACGAAPEATDAATDAATDGGSDADAADAVEECKYGIFCPPEAGPACSVPACVAEAGTCAADCTAAWNACSGQCVSGKLGCFQACDQGLAECDAACGAACATCSNAMGCANPQQACSDAITK